MRWPCREQTRHAAGFTAPSDGGVPDGLSVRPSARPPDLAGPTTLLALLQAAVRWHPTDCGGRLTRCSATGASCSHGLSADGASVASGSPTATNPIASRTRRLAVRTTRSTRVTGAAGPLTSDSARVTTRSGRVAPASGCLQATGALGSVM